MGIDNLLGNNQSSFASYMQFVYKPIQGLHLILKYDYFDSNYDISDGAVTRYSYGFEFFPLNMLEIKLQARKYSTENISLGLDVEYLLQLHTWF